MATARPVPAELLRCLGSLLTADGAEPAGSTDPRDLADVLWLARVCGLRPDEPADGTGEGAVQPAALPPLPAIDAEADERATAAWNAALREAVDRVLEEQAGQGAAAAQERPSPPRSAAVVRAVPAAAVETGSDPVVPFFLPPVPGPAESANAPAATVRTPARPALTGTLALSRALRPLRRTVRSAHDLVLDEEATVSVSGQAGLLLPVWRGAPERWLDVDLVVDGGPTMAVWSTLGDELAGLLRRHGAFHRVRAWSVHDRAGTPVLTPRGVASVQGGGGGGPAADPRGRRIVLLLTDGVGPLWHSGALPAAMRGWSRRAPVTLLQVLPRRHWHRTALRPVPAQARVRPGVGPTVHYIPDDEGWAEPGTAWAGVLELRADWLAPWARMLSGRASGWTPVLALPLTGTPRSAEPGPSVREDPAEVLARFRREASQTAYELAGFLAAAPLSLPVMRHVQAAMLGDSSATHLAEIYLSGLLERRSPERPGEDPEAVLYDFRPGLRERLLGTLTRSESAAVLGVLVGVSQSVAGSFGGTLDFRALAALADGGSGIGPGLPPESVPFAEVAVEVLRGLGGADRALAERLAVRLPAGSRARSAAVRAEQGGPQGPVPGERRAEPDEPLPERPGFLGADEAGAPRPERRWWQRRRTTATGALPGAAAEPPGAQVPVLGSDTAPAPPTWNNLPPGLPDVTGWEGRLLQVERVLHPGGSAAAVRRAVHPLEERSLCLVQGQDGTGKTTVALAYAHLHLADYSLVWWVDGSSRETVSQSLDQLATLQGLPLEEDVPAALNRWLTEHPGWLIVIDDLGRDFAEEERWMAGYSPRTLVGDRWPPDGYGSVLITSRVVTNDGAVLQGHTVQFLADQWRAVPAETAATPDDDLAALPGLLTRAADGAVPPGAGARPAAPQPESEERVGYGPLLDQLAAEDGPALDVLRACAFLAATGLSIELINQGLLAAGGEPGTGVESDAFRLSAPVIGRLSARRLLRITPNHRGSAALAVPARLQQAVRSGLTAAERKAWAVAAVRALVASFPSDPAPTERWPVCTALLPHAHTVLQLPGLDDRSLRPRAELLHQLARFRSAQGEFDSAEAYLRQRRFLVRGLPAGSADVDAALLMARVLYGAGRYAHVLEYVTEVLDGDGERNLRSVQAHRLAAAVLRESYLLDESRTQLHAARTLLTPAVPTGPLVRIEIRRETALTELEAGRLAEAEEQLELAWTELLRLGSDRPRDADLLEVAIRQDRARISLLRGRPGLSTCEVLAASIRKAGKRLDPEGLDVIMRASETLVDITRAALDELKPREEAGTVTYRSLWERRLAALTAIAEAVLAYRREHAREQPHRLAAALDMNGMLLSALGRFVPAAEALEEAAGLTLGVHGDHHPAWAENRWRLAQVLAAAGDHESARTLAEHARHLLAYRLGADHPRLVPIARMLA
ncbi:SAV_2336 N-terminal domain-related protein [Kitasatospora sp. NPDC101176]|uniref:SAV_2336 N-terminal domain-related protein n=1 Tax=Kitasatospora sp. NPDC101176 TaxID=3364099 RepID=UPI0037FE42F8